MRKLQQRGEGLDSFTFRDATENDIEELGVLHAETWAQTYNAPRPNYKLRQDQWRKAFAEENDGSWFCILVVGKNNKLVGFAKGKTHKNTDSNNRSGDLNKIYLLHDYQRIGLGKKLIGHVARRFLSMGVNEMGLFGTSQNPSCAFHDAMGGERLYSENGIFGGCYRWRDLQKLAAY
ncbi:MAG: GNAT family N-acetyltransferase [Chitinophagales bacterium]